MRLFRVPVVLFLLAAGLPFVLAFAFFVISQRQSLLMEPETYMAFLKREGSATHMIPLETWKHFLAQDDVCRNAQAIVIGSSRVREVDAAITGMSTCNLYVDGLAAAGFAHLARVMPPATSGRPQIVYVGIDHFWAWAVDDQFDSLNLWLLGVSRMLWKVWAVLRPLGFITYSDVVEAVRRLEHTRAGDGDYTTFYEDGHSMNARYYADKRIGKYRHFDRQAVEDSVAKLFAGARLHEPSVRALEAGVRMLHAKGYAVRMFWNPVSPGHAESARRHYPYLFRQTMDVVDGLARRVPLDRYLPAATTLDPTALGCTEHDYFDLTHVDADCLRILFADVLGDRSVTLSSSR